MRENFVDESAEGTGGSQFNIEEWIKRGINWQQYIASCTKNIGRMKDVYSRLSIPQETAGFFRSKGPFTIMCIAEDWCPDCVQNVPLLIRLSEALPMTRVRLFFRDRNKELMDHYKTSGKRIVPTVIFLDRDLNEVGRWAGPSRKAKKWTLETLVKGRKIEDIPQEERRKFGILYDEKFFTEFAGDSLSEMKAALE